MALGLWCTLQGPYTVGHTLTTLQNLLDGANSHEREDMPKWVFALSTGMECEDVTVHGGYRIANVEIPAPPSAPGSPHSETGSGDEKMSPEEMRQYMEGKDDGDDMA